MLTPDQYPAIFFVALVLTVYFLAVWSLIAMVLARVKKTRLSSNRPATYLRRIVLILASIGTACVAYGFVEPYRPEVTRIELFSPKVADADGPIRIVHISDVHSDPRARLEGRLPAIIAEQTPDLILFSGDAANSSEGLPVFKGLLSALARLAPTYVVKGNWDLERYSSGLFEGTGANELDGRGSTVEVRGTKIWVSGVAVGHTSLISNMLRDAPKDQFSLFVHHFPDEIYEVADKVDLYCAGHTHGGQVALPWYGALLTLSRFGKRFEAGLYQVGQTQLYVNRGIGMEGGSAPRVRFFARPEITVYEIRKR